MSLKHRLLKKQQEKKANWNIIELDNALSWVLAAIGEDPKAKENLIFKGGTCLKKCYFGEHYRFSEDLDFSANSEDEVNLVNFRSAFITKCQNKDIQFEDPQQFFTDQEYLQQIKRDWDQFLEGLLLEELPCFENTMRELETMTWQVFQEPVYCWCHKYLFFTLPFAQVWL